MMEFLYTPIFNFNYNKNYIVSATLPQLTIKSLRCIYILLLYYFALKNYPANFNQYFKEYDKTKIYLCNYWVIRFSSHNSSFLYLKNKSRNPRFSLFFGSICAFQPRFHTFYKNGYFSGHRRLRIKTQYFQKPQMNIYQDLACQMC